MGRPGPRRDHWMQVRFNDEEAARLDRVVKDRGGTKADAIRALINEDVARIEAKEKSTRNRPDAT